MTQEYLQKYNFTEERFVAWLKSQGMDPFLGVNVLLTYAKEGKIFRNGDELCVQIAKDVHKIEMDKIFYLAVSKLPEKFGEVSVKEEGVTIAYDDKYQEKEKSRWRKIWDTILGR